MTVQLQIEGVDELRKRMSQYPSKFNQVLDKTIDTSLLTIQQEIPPYPVYQSKYRRTGTLGRTVGLRGGRPDIYEKEIGPNMFSAEYGSRLKYAPYVIGETTQAKHMKHWWTLDGTVLKRAAPKIQRLFKIMADKLAAWLDGKAGI